MALPDYSHVQVFALATPITAYLMIVFGGDNYVFIMCALPQ